MADFLDGATPIPKDDFLSGATPLPPKPKAAPQPAPRFPVRTPAQSAAMQKQIEGTAEGLQPTASDPAYIIADAVTGGLAGGVPAAAQAALGSVVAQNAQDLVAKATGHFTNNPYVQGAAGLAGGLLAGHALPSGAPKELPEGAKPVEAVEPKPAEPAPTQPAPQPQTQPAPQPQTVPALQPKPEAPTTPNVPVSPSGETPATTLQSTPVPLLPQVAQGLAKAATEAPQKVVSGLRSFKERMNYTFAPESLGPEAGRMGQIIRENAADYAAKQYRSKALLDNARDELEKVPDVAARYRNFYTPIQRGEIDQLPAALRPVAKNVRQMFDERWDAIDKLTGGSGSRDQIEGLLNYRDNYLPHLFADPPEKVREVFGALENVGGKQLQASTKFFRKKLFDDMTEAIEKGGLTPKYNNPADMILAGLRNEDRYILGQTVAKTAKDEGLFKFFRPGEHADGWSDIDDRIAQVKQFSPSEKGLIERGSWKAPDGAALVINRFLSPGLRGEKGIAGGLGNINRSFVSEANAFRVGFSAFHFLFETINHAAENVGEGVFRTIGGALHGDATQIGKGIKQIGRGAIAPIDVWRAYTHGGKLQRALIQPGSQGAEWDRGVQMVLKGGGRFGRETAAFTDGMLNGLKDIGQLENASNLTKAVKLTSKPLMDYFVPRVKLGAFLNIARGQMESAMARSGGVLSEADERAILQGAWDHVDHVFGQMTRDNQFMSNAMKDAMHVAIAFPGWQYGTIAAVKNAATGAAKALTGRGPTPTEKMALQYGVGLLATHMWINSILNYAMTGEPPKSLHDLFQARDGGKDQYGNPTRINAPDYMRTLISAGKHPVRWAENVVNLPFQWAEEAINNRDYNGNEIYNPQDSLYLQIGQVAKHYARDVLPFSIQNVQQAKQEQGVGSLRKSLSYAGISPVAREFRQTKAENMMDDILGAQRIPQTPEEQEHNQLAADLRKNVKAGDKITGADMGDQFSANDIKHALHSAVTPAFQSRFSQLIPLYGDSAHVAQGFKNALQVYAASTPEEKKMAGPILLQKFQKQHKQLSPADLQQMMPVLQQIWSAQRPTGRPS